MFSLDAPLAPAIDAFVNPENDDNVHKTSLNTVVMQVHRKVTMEALIQALGQHLTSTDDKVRARATQLLAEVLARLPELPLTPNAVQLLIDFFADRLADFPSASACLQALLALESNHAAKIASPSVTIALVQKMVKLLHVPQLGQAMRKKCFELMQLALAQPSVASALVAAPSPGASDDGVLFAQAFLNAMEGEKDPRNLLLCLQIARALLATLAPVFARHDALLQQYFDVTSCYFPITFTPPPNDPYGITSEELILSLRRAFAASDVLAKHTVPFLLEKLSSTVVEAKLDSLETLVFCCEAYAINVLLLHMHAIANALYHEVVKGEKKEVIAAALRAIARFASVIGLAKTREAGGAAYAWNKFVVELTTRATSDLAGHAADSLVSVSAGHVLAALGKDSVLGFAHVLDASIPLLVQQFNESAKTTASQCEASVARILLLVDTIDREVDQSASAQPMRPHARALIDALVAYLTNASAQSSATSTCAAICALAHLVTYPPSPIVDAEDVKALIELFTRSLLFDARADVRAASLQSLHAISTIKQKTTVKHYAAFVMDISLAQLMDAVKASDAASERVQAVLASSQRTYDAFFQDVLDAITQLSQAAPIFEATTVRLVDLCVRDDDSSSSTVFVATRETESILNAVAKIVELNGDDRASMEFCVTSGGDRSIVFRLLAAVNHTPAATTRIGDATLAACVRILRTPMQCVSVETQQLLVNAAVVAFLRSHADASAPQPASLQLVPLFSAVINSANRSVALPDSAKVINTLLELAQSSSSDGIASDAALSAAKSLASIVNKMSDGDEFDALISLLLERKLSRTLLDEQEPLAVRVAALQIYAWIAKALVIRGHKEHAPACLLFLCKFLTPLSDAAPSPMRMEVAKSFKLLVTEYPDVLNRKCGALITVRRPCLVGADRHWPRVLTVSCLYVVPVPPAHVRPRVPRARRLHPHERDGEQRRGACSAVVRRVELAKSDLRAAHWEHLAAHGPGDQHGRARAREPCDEDVQGAAVRVGRERQAVPQGRVPRFAQASAERVRLSLSLALSLDWLAMRGTHAFACPYVCSAGALDRHDALECLAKLAAIPYELIHPYKDLVLRQLLRVLDDRKRFVRHAAVRVRNQWSVL